MQILKIKKKLIINNLDNYQVYLKNLNFFNKLKKKNKILLKDTFLLKLKNFYLLNLNSKENFFFENIKLKKKKDNNNKNLLYVINKKNSKKDLLINFNFINYFILNLYTYLLFKKIIKYKVKKFFIKIDKNKEIFYKKSKNIFPYIKGRIIKYKGFRKKKHIDRKYIMISFFSLIKKMKSYYLYKKRKDLSFIKSPYLKRRYKKKTSLKYIFKKFRKKTKNFKVKIINNKKIQFNSSRKAYVSDFNKKIKNYNLKKNYDLYNVNLFKKYSKLFIEK